MKRGRSGNQSMFTSGKSGTGQQRRGNPASESKPFQNTKFPDSFEGQASNRTILFICILLIGINLFIYAPSFHFGFVSYDDPSYVSENVQVSHGITMQGLIWAFTTGHSSNWHPITWLSHMLDVQLYGMDAQGHHRTSILLHIANTLLLFWLLYRMTGALGRSTLVAALFAVHPLHVESVAWIAERKDVLSTFFMMIALHSYVNYARRPRFRQMLLVSAILALGLMSKPMLVSFPLLLILLDLWPLHRVSLDPSQYREWMQLIREKIPLFVLAGLSSIATIVAQSRGGAIQNFELIPLGLRAANAAVSYIRYIIQMLWPHGLFPHYQYETLPGWLVAGGLALLLLLSALAFRSARQYPFMLMGWLWYLISLLPVIGLIQVGTQARADRYTYVPIIGLFVIAVWGSTDLLKRWRQHRIGVCAIAGILICCLTAVARNQVEFWENDLTLWKHAVQIAPDNCFARTNLGIALVARGDLVEAGEQYKEALRIDPRFPEAQNALGTILFKQGHWSEAVPYYSEALRLRPGFAEAHTNLGTVLWKQGKTEEALLEFRQALKLDPENAEIRYNLGFALAGLNRFDEAVAQYSAAIEIRPSYAEAHRELGNVLFLQGKLAEAVSQYTLSLEIKYDSPETHNNLGVALRRLNREDEAIAHFYEALRINPNSAEAQRNLADTSVTPTQ